MRSARAISPTALVLATLALSSCSNNEYLARSTDSHEQSILVNNTSVIVRPIVADMSIENERKATIYQADLLLPLEDLRDNALGLFLAQHECDYAVDPIYREVVTSQRRAVKSIQITVEAFPAHYVSLQAVDSLPKSILEYQRLNVPQERVTYITERNLRGTAVGFEMTMGNFGGMQIDVLVPNRSFRFYFGTDEAWDFLGGDMALDFEYIESIGSNVVTSSRLVQEMRSNSFGLMKEIEPTSRLSLRGFAGLNLSEFEFSEVYLGSEASFDGMATLGVRVGAGADFPIFRNMSFVAKAHRNMDLVRIIGWRASSSDVGKEFLNSVAVDGPPINVGFGLRFEFTD